MSSVMSRAATSDSWTLLSSNLLSIVLLWCLYMAIMCLYVAVVGLSGILGFRNRTVPVHKLKCVAGVVTFNQ